MPTAALPAYKQNEALVAAYQAGDPSAADSLLRLNRLLICQAASAYLSRSGSLEFDDLFQEGAIGLLHAARRFDPERGNRFSTYATHCVRRYISRACENYAWTIRLPLHIEQRARKAVATSTDEEWGASLPNVAVSLDQLVTEDGDTCLGDLLPGRVDVEAEAIGSVWAREVLDSLPPKERHVLACRCGFVTGDPETCAAIGRPMGLTRERIRQVEAKALTRLRERLATE